MLRSLSSTTYFPQLVEAIVTCLIFSLAFTKPALGASSFQRLEQILHSMAKRPASSALAIAAAVIAIRLLLLPLLPVPRPSIHDEFSYLLAAQTFASGRLANTPHPFWPNFESIHILQQPTYMSMYPPGQGLALAAGIWLTGQAWAGVLLTSALLCSVLFWALNGWLPSSWALAGALLAAVRWGLVSYWTNSFWGGSLPALGGALVFGTLPRLARRANWKNTSILALGLLILANTRPYEGLICALSSLTCLVIWSRREGTLRRLYLPVNLLPIALVFLTFAPGMLFYNARVSGDPFLLPYIRDRQQYAIAPLFIWGKLRPVPHYNSESLKKVYVAEANLYRFTKRAWGIPELFRKLKNIWVFFLGPLLSIPFVFLLFGRGRRAVDLKRKRRYAAAIVAAGVLATLQGVWFYPHYLAPVLAPLLACLLFGFRELRGRKWRGQPTGLFLCRAIPIGCLLMMLLPIVARPADWHLRYWPLQWALGFPDDVHPPELERRLLANHRKALVFVEYGPDHDFGDEWVYNAADIDASPIVWARSTNPQQDAALIRYFHDRNTWLLRPDEWPLFLIPLEPSRSAQLCCSTHATR